MIRRSVMTRPLGRALSILSLAAATSLAVVSPADAAPRNDMRAAYGRALASFNDLEIEAALEIVNEAIAAAEAGGAGEDPVLASLFLLRAGLQYSLMGADSRAEVLEDLTRAVRLNYYVVVPLEFRSEELSAFLTEARGMSGRKAPSRIEHELPAVGCGEDLQFEALLGVPDGGSAVLYWRRASSETFQEVEMEVFSNVAETTISGPEHGDFDVEYAIYSFDANGQPAYNKGTADQPIVLRLGCREPEPETKPASGPADAAPEKPPIPLPRVWINLGLGTGFGLAKGDAELTYSQYFPNAELFRYDEQEYACALARWAAGGVGSTLPTNEEFFGTSAGSPSPDSLVGRFGPTNASQASAVATAYLQNAGACTARHPVTEGLAGSPFFIEPEVQVRVAKNLTVSLYGRLQVVSGSRVFRDDPTKPLFEGSDATQNGCGENNGDGGQPVGPNGTSWCDDVYNPDPGTQSNFRDRPSFTWAVGSKLRYYFLKESSPVRLFAGGFFGYGQSRLRVPLGFANDRNGNSVPDDRERSFGRDSLNQDVSTCFPIFPYRDACETPNSSQTIAGIYASQANSEQRFDTVAIGQGFVGGLFGFNYYIMKNVSVFGEVQVGGWFPQNSSFLVDLNLGPAITF